MAKVAFVQNLVFEYLGVMYLSAMLKKHGHTVEVFIVDNDGASLAGLEAFKPDIVGFPCTTGMHVWASGFAAALKKRLDCMVVIGGPHATFFPEIIREEGVDVVCRGEGEYALLALAGNVDRGVDSTDTANCWFKKNGSVIRNEVRDLTSALDELPFPDRDLYISKYPHLNKSQKAIIGGRGCPFDCTFCFNHAYKRLYHGKGKVVRYRSVDNIIAEIRQIRERHDIRTVYMQDDTFILNKAWVREFCRKYREEIGLPFICLVRADLADGKTIRLLAETGCKSVFFGVETGSEDLRNRLLKKSVTNGQIVDAARLLKRSGIKFRTYNMLGLPGETLEQAFETVRINQEIGADFPWCSLFYPFPGMELTNYAFKCGALDAGVELNNPSFFKESMLKSGHRRELVNLQKLFFYAVKFPFLMPFIRRLIRLRPNIFFDIAFLAGYAWCYRRSENLTFGEVLSAGMRNVKGFFFAKGQRRCGGK